MSWDCGFARCLISWASSLGIDLANFPRSTSGAVKDSLHPHTHRPTASTSLRWRQRKKARTDNGHDDGAPSRDGVCITQSDEGFVFLRRHREASHNEMFVTDGPQWELGTYGDQKPSLPLTDSVPERRELPSSVPASTSQRVWVAPASLQSNGPLPTTALRLLSGGGASS